VTKRSLSAKGFGLTLEVPDRVGQMVRRILPQRTPPPQRLVVQPPPPVAPESRARQLAVTEEFAARAAKSSDQGNGNGGTRSDEVIDEVDAHPWYHTIELPDGVTTEGRYDHRPLLPYYGLPADLQGKRALDVGSGDGFWAFELERRGAKVTSLDIETFADVDLPRALHEIFARQPLDLSFRHGLEIAHRRLGSTVELVNGPVYELDADVVGRFDFVHAGDILLHLRDPALALQRLRAVCTGELLVADCYDPALDALGAGPNLTRYRGGWDDATWWGPALSTLVQMVADAGFEDVALVTTYALAGRETENGPWRAVLRARA
jgi:tRNA (mo5U34)-methyltransferase